MGRGKPDGDAQAECEGQDHGSGGGACSLINARLHACEAPSATRQLPLQQGCYVRTDGVTVGGSERRGCKRDGFQKPSSNLARSATSAERHGSISSLRSCGGLTDNPKVPSAASSHVRAHSNLAARCRRALRDDRAGAVNGVGCLMGADQGIPRKGHQGERSIVRAQRH